MLHKAPNRQRFHYNPNPNNKLKNGINNQQLELEYEY
jgi:hypothetical protein